MGQIAFERQTGLDLGGLVALPLEVSQKAYLHLRITDSPYRKRQIYVSTHDRLNVHDPEMLHCMKKLCACLAAAAPALPADLHRFAKLSAMEASSPASLIMLAVGSMP